ncbi:porin [Flavobacterium sp.]|uniref:porin n=1 Tax=Flavobacterium sp. TaxID=239 RepID=UPI0038D20099
MKIFKKLFCLTLLSSVSVFSQESADIKITFSGYLETYYANDFQNSNTEKKLPFMYNYNRQNEFNLNIGLIRTKVAFEKGYANFALHSGTYVEDNYANEKIKNISEAFIGLYLDKEKKQTIEVGIMPSYIGFESANSSSNLTLTRSILGENSPYFMTGVKYNYSPSSKWSFSGLLTNGWQRIAKPNKKALPSFGSQIACKPSDNATLNWSVFIGDESIAEDLRTRYFSNLYYDFKWKNNFRTIFGFDYGFQKNSVGDGYDNWFSPILITQYSINSKWQTAVRAEYYQDVKNVIISSGKEFKTLGTSLNFDYLPNSKMKIRTELRYFNSKEAVFLKNDAEVNSNLFATMSWSYEF